MPRHQIEIVPVEPVMVTVEDAGRLCGVEKSLAYELVAQKIIPAVKFSSRCIRVPLDALRQRMNELALAGLTPVDALLMMREERSA